MMDYRRMSRWIVLAVAMVTLTVGALAVSAASTATSVLKNGDFEGGRRNWASLKATLTTGAPAQGGKAAAHFTNTTGPVSGQLFQSGVVLQPNTEYELTFWARSDGGHDLSVMLTRNGSTVGYGLNETFDVGTDWQQFSTTFTTSGFNSPVRNGRLRFHLPAGKGFSASVDSVSLAKADAPPPPPPPPGGSFELRVFDWNQPVTVGMSGFAQYKPLSTGPNLPNGNWVSPNNYTRGTLWFRAEVKSIPKPQDQMRLGFCFWQTSPKYGEECSSNYPLAGVAGNGGVWSQRLDDLAVIHKAPIDWASPRWKAGFVVRNNRGPISKKLGFNWQGENPANWYPLNIHYTIILTDGPEPDWTKYGWPKN